MLRAGLGLRDLAGDFGRRWAAKPVTDADADDPDAAAKSVGAAAENEMRVAAGAYRGLVPPGARAAYDRSTAEAAKSANKQAADAVRARARAAHETGTRATLAEADRALAAELDEAIRNGDHPRAETLTAQRDDLRRFTQAYLRLAPATAPAKADAPPSRIDAPPAPSEAPVPAAAEPEKKDAPGHDPGALMPGSADADTAKALSPDTPQGLSARDRVKPTESRDPAAISTMDETGAYAAPTDHARALRGKFCRRVKPSNADRLFFVWVYPLFGPISPAVPTNRPGTLVRGQHRCGFRRYWH